MDSIGAAIGILKVAQANNKDGFIVIDPNQIGSSVQRLIGEIKKYEELWSRFITPEEAMEISNDDTLLVIVDTHKRHSSWRNGWSIKLNISWSSTSPKR